MGSENQISMEIDSKKVELPIKKGTLGRPVVIIKGIADNGYYSFDPGFGATAACESKITFINGEEGLLLHRGYPIADLAAHSDYMETCYLLLHGELPNEAEKNAFITDIKHYSSVHEQIGAFYNGFRRDAHPDGDHDGCVL